MIEFKKDRTFDSKDYEPYVGKFGNERLAPLPNAEDVDPLFFLSHLASGGHMMQPRWGYALHPEGNRPQWTMFFLTSFMMSGLDGGGYAVIYSSRKEGPYVQRFYICKHAVEDHAGANHSRGWHPGHCSLCGYNMTYDSGD
jgi:hypothetical protein